jgi:hypothetical protein
VAVGVWTALRDATAAWSLHQEVLNGGIAVPGTRSLVTSANQASLERRMGPAGLILPSSVESNGSYNYLLNCICTSDWAFLAAA